MDKEKIIQASESSRCITCNTELRGDYCYNCGEKKITPSKDHSVKEFIEEAVEGLVHLDSKFFNTFWLLISKPGFLAAEYNRGHRKPYMKPIQVFIVATVLFYFVFPPSYLFFISIENMEDGYYNAKISGTNIFHYDLEGKIKQIAAQKTMTKEQVGEEVVKEAFHKSKEYLFIILPFFACIVYLLFRKTNPYYIPHLILALYLLSFFIIANLLAISILTWVFRLKDATDWYFYSMSIIFSGYVVLSEKNVYKSTWFQSLWKSAIVIVWFIVLVLVYRQVITIWAANSV